MMNRFESAALLFGIFFATANAVLPDPTHRWTFNEGDAIDSIGGIVGEAYGAATYSDEAFEGSKSLYLPCCDSNIVLRDQALKQPFTYYTVSLWFRALEFGGYRYLYEEGGAKNGFAVRLNDSSLEVAVIEGAGGLNNVKVASAPTPIETGRWYHAAATYTNGEISITLNASASASVGTGFGELDRHNNEASIGGGGLVHSSSELYFEGFVDDIRIYDGIALTSAQISELYATASPPDNRPNFLLIVADDMNYDSPGFMGGVAPDVSPNLDKLASESRVFSRAHAANSVCQPSRQVSAGIFRPERGMRCLYGIALESLAEKFAFSAHLTTPFFSFPSRLC